MDLRKRKVVMTSVFVMQPGKVLLGLKKRGFAVDRWNGFGGKVTDGESIEECAEREILEECLLNVSSLDKAGVLLFEFINDPVLLEIHVFRTDRFEGTVQETEEMSPRWFNFSEIPFDSMWPDNTLWFPLLLNSKYFNGYFKYEGHNKILEYTLSETTAITESQESS